MGAARENYPDENLVRQIHAATPQLSILTWANHGYANEGMFKDEILESIHHIRKLLNDLETEVNKKGEN